MFVCHVAVDSLRHASLARPLLLRRMSKYLMHVHFKTSDTFLCLPPRKEEVNAFARVCLSVCLSVCLTVYLSVSVSTITQKRVHAFG